MKILSFVAENFKKIRVVEIVPKGRVTTISGRNGQGKTSLWDAIVALFEGRAALPDKPVRKGAARGKLEAILSDDQGRPYLVAKRTIAEDRSTTLTIEAVPGAQRPAGTPQAVLDALIGRMAFDPNAFAKLKLKEQADTLRSLVKLDVDLDDLANANQLDYAERTLVKRRADELAAAAKAVIFSPGLPTERVDEEQIRERRRQAQQANTEIVSRIEEKIRFAGALEEANKAVERNANLIRVTRQSIEEAKAALSRMEQTLTAAVTTDAVLAQSATAARIAWEEAPDGKLVDLRPLDEELEQAQLTNREITKREHQADLERQALEKQQEAARLTRLMEQRDSQKTEALANAKLPVEGLTFDEQGVWLKGIPLAQLAHSEKIRIGCALAIAAVEESQYKDGTGKLRCIPIDDAESLDEQSLQVLYEMAEAHDFQLILFKVDTTGKCGIVLEDGIVQAVNG